MTEKEALDLLELESGFDKEDLTEAVEKHFFEFRRFFLTRVPLEKMFRFRLDKLKQISCALTVLDRDFRALYFSQETDFALDYEDIYEVFQAYQRQNKQIKTRLMQSLHPDEIAFLAENLVQLEKVYASRWFSEEMCDETILVSKEPDPMEVLAAIKSFRGQGGTGFRDLLKMQNTAPAALINEMKRLSLLFWKY